MTKFAQQDGHTLPNKTKCHPDINTLKSPKPVHIVSLVKVPGHMFFNSYSQFYTFFIVIFRTYIQ